MTLLKGKINRAQVVDYYTEKSVNGELNILQIRKELVAKGIEEDEIKVIIKLVDNATIAEALIKSNRTKGRQYIILGLFMILASLFITIGTYIGIFDTGDYFYIIYGPIAAGIGIFRKGLSLRR